MKTRRFLFLNSWASGGEETGKKRESGLSFTHPAAFYQLKKRYIYIINSTKQNDNLYFKCILGYVMQGVVGNKNLN
jgi:hypothetical protein